jgi:uncharacterized protein YkwD
MVHRMRRTVLSLLVLVVAFTAVAVAPAADRAVKSTELAVVQEMNRARAEHGLAPLRTDRTLRMAARSWSADMMRTGVFTHGDFSSRMARFGIRGTLAGENLAWGVGSKGTPAELVRGWLNSPPHRENLLRPSFRRTGVGAMVGTFAGYDGVVLVTADFAG